MLLYDYIFFPQCEYIHVQYPSFTECDINDVNNRIMEITAMNEKYWQVEFVFKHETYIILIWLDLSQQDQAISLILKQHILLQCYNETKIDNNMAHAWNMEWMPQSVMIGIQCTWSLDNKSLKDQDISWTPL